MNPILSAGLLIGLLCSAWTFVMKLPAGTKTRRLGTCCSSASPWVLRSWD
jgi:hypothetical protein